MRKLIAVKTLLICALWFGVTPAEVLFRSVQASLPNADLLVSLDADETPIAAALSLLALQIGVDVIVAPDVSGNVSIHVTDIPFRDALRALTSGRDITYHTAGEVVVVAPISSGNKAGMGTLVFRLRHLRPTSILEAVKTLMSTSGEAVPLIEQGDSGGEGQEGAPPIIIFKDYPEHLELLEAALGALDVPQQQVLIDVKFVEARTSDIKNLGVEWNASIQATLGSSSDSSSGSSSQNSNFSFVHDLNSGQSVWGTFGVSKLNAIVNYLVSTDHAKVMSQPQIAVMDNERAEIRITTTNPVQTVNRISESAVTQDVVTYQYIETGIKLVVRPRISDDGYVSLYVNPIFEEILGMVGPAESPAPVTAKRSVETTVKVKSGETLALGGLIRETEIESVSKVWLLGDIPIIGSLFRRTRTEKVQSELMIFITPTVLPTR